MKGKYKTTEKIRSYIISNCIAINLPSAVGVNESAHTHTHTHTHTRTDGRVERRNLGDGES